VGKPLLEDHVTSLLLGEMLGEGIARQVYACRIWPEDYVIKVQTRDSLEDHDYQNLAEWDLWCNASADLRKWLAPCISLSPGGGALMQARCEPCPTHLVPKKMPKVLGDMHLGNLGIYEGKVVMTDYGRHLAYRYAANARAMRKVDLDAYTKLTTRS
jgi:hypothetical protein